MQLLVGLFFFSVLLTTGSSLMCEHCASQTSDCSGSKQECSLKNAVCMTLTTEVTAGPQKLQATIKGCSPEESCKTFENLKGKTVTSQNPDMPAIPAGAVVKQAVCSRAPPSFASFFPAFLGLLLMKLLF
ncbi:phospholipase A2 inhibitor subunit gamma B [Protobothrops mucrosquamatus]|uniref:phospholipase A2 inhibitor subunit gamma B n=1 Tax=Protobothrops mucrosquamatus TaxID=103944 RepID=UPI000775EE9E|nr:phospholipase A2 inhibitor subunit gamma B [Protobothrops mucrosquamatus]